MTILHFLSSWADESFSLDCIEMILSHHQIDINKRGMVDGNYGLTAAHMAISKQKIKVLKLLVDKDCDLFPCESYGKNVLDYALKEKDSFPEMYDIVKKGLNRWYDRQQSNGKTDSAKPQTNLSKDVEKVCNLMTRARLASESSADSVVSYAGTKSSPLFNIKSRNSAFEYWRRKAEESPQQSSPKRLVNVPNSPQSDIFYTPKTGIPPPPPLPPSTSIWGLRKKQFQQ